MNPEHFKPTRESITDKLRSAADAGNPKARSDAFRAAESEEQDRLLEEWGVDPNNLGTLGEPNF